jgi:rhamnulose-1-phosphate aldolase
MIPELSDASRVSTWLAKKGWSEASGGNFSIRISELPESVNEISGETPQSLPFAVNSLSGQYLLISARGNRAREMAMDAKDGCGLFWILRGGEDFTCLWGNNDHSSELAAHLAIHRTLLEVRPQHRAILHTHPTNLIALTHDPDLQEETQLSDILLRMQSEARIHLPEGLAHLGYHLPGSLELGDATAEALRRTPVALWHMHGAIATGNDLSDALDYLEIVDKVAEIYWRLRSAGIQPIGMSDENLGRSLKQFGVWDRYSSANSSEA